MNGAAFLGVDVDESRIRRRVETRYCDRLETDLGRALALVDEARAPAPAARGGTGRQHRRGAARAGPAGCGARHPHRPDLGARPAASGTSRRASTWRRPRSSASAIRRTTRPGCWTRWPRTCRRCSTLQARGAVTFDYGNNLRGQVADHRGMREAFTIPGFVPAFIRPLFCRGAGPFRWAALSGDPGRHRRDRPRGAGDLPRERGAGPLDPAGLRSGCSSRGCPRGSAGWNTASAPRWGCASTGW